MLKIAAAGAVLGVLSWIEETDPALDAGISSNTLWLALAFLVGTRRGARGGLVFLTTANAAYYAYAAVADDWTPPLGVAAHWFVLGLAAGVVFGHAGRLATARPALALLPAAIIAADLAGATEAILP